jgi:hypothetical protein
MILRLILLLDEITRWESSLMKDNGHPGEMLSLDIKGIEEAMHGLVQKDDGYAQAGEREGGAEF